MLCLVEERERKREDFLLFAKCELVCVCGEETFDLQAFW